MWLRRSPEQQPKGESAMSVDTANLRHAIVMKSEVLANDRKVWATIDGKPYLLTINLTQISKEDMERLEQGGGGD
jgi:hypothetical protein